MLVVGGVSAQSGDISTKADQSLGKIQGWLSDLGVDNAQSVKVDVKKAAPEIRTTLLSGVAEGIAGLKSLIFFLGFATLSALFVLKDGPVMRAFINRHLGVPEPVGDVITSNVAKSLRSYFLGVSIIAGFNAVVIGLAAWVAGGFAVLIALGAEGTDAAVIMAVVSLLANSVLQQAIQPFVMGATLSLNPLVYSSSRSARAACSG